MMTEITAVNDHTVDIKLDISGLACHTKERITSWRDNQDHYEKKELICRVPKKFHEIDGSDYVPHRWSIGPYNNGIEHLVNGEIYKLSSLNYTCEHFQVTLEKYYEELQSLEIEAQSYYSGDISMSTPSFLEMLLLDSCFILYGLTNMTSRNSSTESICNISSTGSTSGAHNSDQINPAVFAGEENSDQNNVQTSRPRSDECNSQVRRPSDDSDFLHDVLLLENQIPFFILQRMYNVARGDESPNEHVASELGSTLKNFIQYISKTTVTSEPPEKIYHLLHLLHWFLRPSKEQNDRSQVGSSWLIKQLRMCCETDNNQQEEQFMGWKVIPKWLAEKRLQWMCPTDNNQQDQQFRRWRRAVEYYEAGVHFKSPQQSSHSPLDIKFENGELRIPMLIIDEKTSYIFGNLLAFEEETARFGYDITTYITFMSQLLSMPEDVTLLSRKGIIEHHLGCDEDVSELFKNLTKFRFVDMGPSSYLKPVCDGLEKHYQNHWNRWFAWLRHKHMKNPWLILALLVAAIVAISAVVQTFCSVIPLVHGKDSKQSS